MMIYKYLFRSFVIVACCLQQCCRGQSTTVRPYKFGFNIDQQQHRREMRDERGIVMGEFGFITADGIYHVTVYATDEQGRFRILAMKNYPYESPPKTVEVMVQPKIPPKTTTTTTTAKPLARHNFNTQACSGCFLTNGNNVAKGTNTIDDKSLKSGSGGSSAVALGQQIYTKSSTHTDKTKLITTPNTQHATNRATFVTTTMKTKEIKKEDKTTSKSRQREDRTISYWRANEKDIKLNSLNATQFFKSPKYDATTSHSHFNQHLKPVTHTSLMHDGARKDATTVRSNKVKLHKDQVILSTKNNRMHPANNENKSSFNGLFKQIPHTNLKDKDTTKSIFQLQAEIMKSANKIISLKKNQVQSTNNSLASNFRGFRTPLKIQGSYFNESRHEQHKNTANNLLITNEKGTVLLNNKTEIVFNIMPQTKTKMSYQKGLSETVSVGMELPLINTFQKDNKSTALTQGEFLVTRNLLLTNSTTTNNHSHSQKADTRTINQVVHKQNTTHPAFPKNYASQPKSQGDSLPSLPAAKTTTVNPPPVMDIIMQKVLPALVSKTGQSAAASPPQATTLNNNKPNAVPSGEKSTTSNNAVAKKATGSSGPGVLNGDGDLYRFKYILDYHGHTETGKRNGNKEGSYFAIGDDNIERKIEYVANEFGYQPRVRWRKLDTNEIKSNENTLKDYEFIWFSQ